MYRLLGNEEGEYAIERERIMSELLDDFEAQVYTSWFDKLPSEIKSCLKYQLLTQDLEKILHVNFDLLLIVALKDTQNIKLMNTHKIPDRVLQFFELEDIYWKYRLRLSRVSEWYNFLRSKCEPCEFNLIRKEVELADDNLKPALWDYTWNDIEDNECDDYTSYLYDMVKDLYTRVKRAEKNKLSILESVRSWGSTPLFHRKDFLPSHLFNFDDRDNILWNRLKNCQKTTKLIRRILDDNFRLFFDIPFNEEDERSMEISKSKSGTSKTESGKSVDDSIAKIVDHDEVEDEDVNEMLYITQIERTPSQNLLFRAYEEYLDDLLGQELMKSINIRLKLNLFFSCKLNFNFFLLVSGTLRTKWKTSLEVILQY